MKSYYQDLSYKLSQNSLSTLQMKGVEIVFDIHHHEEYEIVFINSGFGKRIIADKVQTYNDGDFILVNNFVPHTWYPCMSKAKVTVVQFKKTLIDLLIKFPEFNHLARFFNQLKTFAQLHTPDQYTLSILEKIHQATSIDKLFLLIHLLDQISTSQYQSIEVTSFVNYSNEQQKRINIILEHIHENFRTTLKLEEVASKHNMSVSNLCKFFKKHTAMTFSAYLNLLRIQSCCFMLENTDHSISTIAYENGFNNIAYFNRIFLGEMGCSPKQFRAKNSV